MDVISVEKIFIDKESGVDGLRYNEIIINSYA